MPSSRSLALHFRFSLFLSQRLKISTLGKVHWWELEGRLRMSANFDYSRLLAHAENEVGSVHSLNTGAFSQGISSNTIPLSENIVYNAYHGTHIYQSIPYLDDNGQSRWNPGLDDWWQSSTSMDWADALNYTFWGPEHGMPQRQVGDQGLIVQESCALG